MRLPRECYQMQQVIETHPPHLSQPQLTGLVPVSSTGQALWVCGAVLAGSVCQNGVASALSPWGRWNNLRQYLREWLYDGSDRARPCRTELDVSLCFAPLLRWVLVWWRPGRLALAVDPTLKGDQTTAIVISVVYQGCAIPVARHIRRATQPGSWMDPTVELLGELAPAVPREMTVIVLCHRGIASPKLWRQIRAQSLPPARPGGWHPYMRYRKNVSFCAQDGRRLPAQHFVSRPDTAWIGRGAAFSTPNAKRRCTLLAVWYVEQEEPWVILTDLPPEDAGPSWYALRFWIELGFKACPRPRPGGRQKPGLEVGQDQKDRSGADLPPLAGVVGGDAAGPGLRHPGGRRRLPAAATLGAGRYGPSASSATASTGCGGCCTGAASGAGSGCCLSLGRNPSPTWRSPAMPRPENTLHTLVRGTGLPRSPRAAAWSRPMPRHAS